MELRDVSANDLAELAQIEGWAIENTASNFLLRSRDRAAWERLYEDREPLYPWLVAARGDRVVGFALSFRYRARSAYDWTTEVSVYVDPEHQGQGIGRSLYNELFARLERLGFHTAVAVVVTPNAASERLHESLGFRRVGTLTEVGWKHDAWRDTTYYEKRLNAGAPGNLG
jgi:phosphinothricin acetyltransferase